MSEEFKNEEVGLVVKGHWMNNSLIDRRRLTDLLQNLLEDFIENEDIVILPCCRM